MIFLTVGSQMPFDRLVRAVDSWSGAFIESAEVTAQIGDTTFRPEHMHFERELSPEAFRQICARSTLMIGHAGMGTVLTAMDLGKPLIVMPRRGDRQETRNDHQVATARWLAGRPGIWVAWEAEELPLLLNRLTTDSTCLQPTSHGADPRLIAGIRKFIVGG